MRVRALTPALVAALFTFGSVSSAAGAVSLVLPAKGLVGLHATAGSARAARSDLASGLPARLARRARATERQTVSLSATGVRVRSDAFVFASGAAASRLLTAWRHARHGSAVTIGRSAHGAVAVARTGHDTQVLVVWREGPKLGAIALRAATTTADPRGRALAYATLADGALRTPLPVTQWDHVVDQIRPDGTVSRATALEAFEAAYGPLPGARTPPGRRAFIGDGTLAAEWVLGYRSTLTAAQRAIVDRTLGISDTGGRRAHIALYGDSAFHENAALESAASQDAVAEAKQLGFSLNLAIVAGFTDDPKLNKDPLVYAETTPLTAKGKFGSGTPTICFIRFTKAFNGIGDAYQDETVAHEVFHCFQDQLRAGSWTFPPAWVGEGTAEWVGETISPAPVDQDVYPISYIDSSSQALFTRDYRAVGFFGHVQDTFGDLWKRLPAIVTATSSNAAYAAAGGADNAFLATWGASVFRDGSKPAWQMTSPVMVPAFAAHNPAQLIVYNPSITGSSDPVTAPPYTTAQYLITPPSDEPVLHVAIQGAARLGAGEDYTALDNAWFCTASSCKCPDDQDGEVPPTQPLAAPADLGLSGMPDGPTYGDVTSYPLSTFCHSKTSAPNRGIDNGDPYISTFDGGGFGFQQAGEFTVVRSTTDNLEIQGRQQPYSVVTHPGYADSLAMNTAYAMRVGSAIVQIGAGHREALYVDRKLVHPTDGQTIALNGGGTVKYGRILTRVTWPDGTQAVVLLIGTEGVNLFVTPSAARAGHLRGLMGNDDGTASNDYVGRNGHRYPAAVFHLVGIFGGSKNAQRIVYREFGHSWRITQRESLFVYPRGRTTRSYDVKGFPKAFLTLASLPGSARRAAKHTCSAEHVTNPVLLAGCELDVGATGRKQFATSDGALQAAVNASLTPAAPTPLVSKVPWTQLSSQPDTTTIAIPTIATTGAQTVVAYRRGTDQAVEAATFTPSAGGVGPVADNLVLSGWAATSDPVLLGAAGGGLQALVPGDHMSGSDPLNGTVAVPRNPDGSWGGPTLVRSSPDGGVTDAILSADGATPLWAIQGGLTVFAGATENDLSADSPGTAYSPTFGRDAAGHLWLTWYVISLTPGVSGLYMMPLDPTTGTSLGPAVEAPSSDGPNGDGAVALACAATCRLVYVDTTTKPSSIVTWAPGEAAPTTLFAGVDAGAMQSPRTPRAVYTSDGRLWIVWADFNDEQEYAQLGAGPGAAPIEMPLPAGYGATGLTAVATVGTRLVVAGNLISSSGPGTAIFATTLDPPPGR